MPRHPLLIGVLVVLVVAGATVAVGRATSGQQPAGHTLRLVEKNQSFHFIDNPPRGGRRRPPSQGDSFAGTSLLLTRSGKRAGTLYFSCAVVSGGANGANQCTGTLALKGGTLQASTLIRGSGRIARIAIVGGTGAYTGARGIVVSISRGANSAYSDDTIRLLP